MVKIVHKICTSNSHEQAMKQAIKQVMKQAMNQAVIKCGRKSTYFNHVGTFF